MTVDYPALPTMKGTLFDGYLSRPAFDSSELYGYKVDRPGGSVMPEGVLHLSSLAGSQLLDLTGERLGGGSRI